MRRSLGRLPFSPDPTWHTTCTTGRSWVVSHPVNRATGGPGPSTDHARTPAHTPPHPAPRPTRSGGPPARRAPAASPPEASDRRYGDSPRPAQPNRPNSQHRSEHIHAHLNALDRHPAAHSPLPRSFARPRCRRRGLTDRGPGSRWELLPPPGTSAQLLAQASNGRRVE